MADDKVYTPEVIPEQPLPGQEGQASLVVEQSGSARSQVFGQAMIGDSTFPIKKVAHELLSVALNTRSKKILQEFQFTQQGAIQIGSYTPGVNGDIRISPAGIVARNSLGDTTFALDGETGDAVFSGIVQAKDFVISDENGLVSASVFQSDSYRAQTTIPKTNSFSEDVAGSELKLTLVRPAKVLITFYANVWMNAVDSFRGYHIDVGVSIDGNMTFGASNDFARFEQEGVAVATGTCLAFAKTYLLDAGPHSIKLKWAAFSDAEIEMRARGLDYCMLGS